MSILIIQEKYLYAEKKICERYVICYSEVNFEYAYLCSPHNIIYYLVLYYYIYINIM